MADKTTFYKNVTFRNESGVLILNSDRILFQANDDHKDDKNASDCWQWGAIQKHQVTSAKSNKNLLKLISAQNASRSAVFQLNNQEQLNFIRKDITRRLREKRHKMEMSKRRVALESMSTGSFRSSERTSDVSFRTADALDDSISTLGMESRQRLSTSTRRRVSFSELDETNHSRRPMLPMLLDTVSSFEPAVISPSSVKTLAKSDDYYKSFSNTGCKGNKVARFLRFLSILIVGTIVITASNIVGRLGYYNGVVDQPVEWREVFSPVKKTPVKKQEKAIGKKKKDTTSTSGASYEHATTTSLRNCLWPDENKGEQQCSLFPTQLFK